MVSLVLITGSWRLFYNCLLEDFLFSVKVDDFSTSTLAKKRKSSKGSLKHKSTMIKNIS